MQIQETFTVAAPREVVWRFFEDFGKVGRCMPGVQNITMFDRDRYKVVVSQKIGFISATFEITTQVNVKEPMNFMELSSTGRSVRGAVGEVRSKDRVDFESLPGGETQVRLTSDIFVGGMLGALGHKAIMAKSREITENFARAVGAALQEGSVET